MEEVLRDVVCERIRGADAKLEVRAVGKTLQWIFNPTVARCEAATGRPNGHRVQKRSLCDTKSDQREGFEWHTANSRGLACVGEVLDRVEHDVVAGARARSYCKGGRLGRSEHL